MHPLRTAKAVERDNSNPRYSMQLAIPSKLAIQSYLFPLLFRACAVQPTMVKGIMAPGDI
jgi:hypothetical protein